MKLHLQRINTSRTHYQLLTEGGELVAKVYKHLVGGGWFAATWDDGRLSDTDNPRTFPSPYDAARDYCERHGHEMYEVVTTLV